MGSVKSTAVASAFALAFGMAVFPATSQADTVTYVQNSDHCDGTGGCSINTANTIAVSNLGTGASTTLFTITLNMATGFDPINTGFPVTLGFSSTLANLSLNAATGYSTVGPLGATGMDGLGTFPASFYGWLWGQQGGGHGDPANTIVFTLNTASSMTLAAFIATLQQPDKAATLFGLDVIGSTGNTGVIDFGLGTTGQVPLPPAALLFGSALLGLGLLGRRRKKVA